jgi:hypothetical protein
MMDEKTTVSAETDGQPSQAVYLYGLIRTGTVVDLPAVELLVVGDVAAAFERVSAVEWSGPAAEANLQDSAWLVSHACRHGEVVSALNARSAVLPVRFGAIFTSERVLEEFLETHVNEIIPFLERIDGHEEWSLKFFLQADQASAWLLATDPELSLRQQSLSETPGKRYFQEKQLLAAVKKKVLQSAQNQAQRIIEALCLLGKDSHPLRLQASANPGYEMIAHEAWLLPEANVQTFCDQIQHLQEEVAEQGLVIEWSGPWPPYSFAPALGESSP